MTTLTETAAPTLPAERVLRHMRRKTLVPFVAIAAVLIYLAYAWVSFGGSELLARADAERAVLLGTDAVAYKVHVTQSLRGPGDLEIAVEGERNSTYAPDAPPAWVERDGESARVDLGEGYFAFIDGDTVTLTVPDYGTIRAGVEDGEVVAAFPGDRAPEWARASDAKFDARPTIGRRVQVSRARIEVHRYFAGWENFFFPFESPLREKSFSELVSYAFVEERADPERSNLSHIASSFLDNPDWQHRAVFVALWETLLMAFLGTLTAAILALPLSLLAARNFTPSGMLLFAMRRVFDFLRGIDMLIWSLIFIRAFGLGPLTGALAIAFTDTGSLGKLFSEALENVDDRQVEGVRSTGASRLLRFRFGVIPQIMPLLVSQTLYYLESNTRSATVIGALGAGGIGLLLVETMRTARDWENTLYIIVLTVAVVMLMDTASGWLRRRLIGAPVH